MKKITLISLATFLVLLFSTTVGFSQNCVTISCPDDINVCADTYDNGVWGATVSDFPLPIASHNCLGVIGDTPFVMDFEIPESKLNEACWDFNYSQRTGGAGGEMKIFASVKPYGNDPFIVTPFLYMEAGKKVSIDVTYTSGNYNLELYLIDENGGIEDFKTSTPLDFEDIDALGIGTHTIELDPGLTTNGLYRVQFVWTYTGSVPPNSNKADKIGIYGILFDAVCSGGIDFVTTGPVPNGPFFAVGNYELEYTATFTYPDGVTQISNYCTFNLNVGGVVVDELQNVTVCDTYTLPSLTVGNYFTGAGGTGTALSAGASITSTQTIYIYAETGTTPNCSDESSFTVTVNSTPAAPISGGNLTVCSDGTTTQTLTATATGGIITWYTTETGGSPIEGNPIQVGVGSVTYYAESSNEICSSLTRTAVTLTINATPAAPISGGNLTVCSDGSTTQTLTATAIGGTITWYTAATGGSLVTSPTQVGVGTSTYYAQSSNGTCSSLTRTAVTLTINATPAAPISGGNQTVCSDGTTTQTLTATATGGTITWYTSATGGSVVTSPTQVGVGTSTYYAQSSNGTCSSLTRTAVTLTINATPAAPISGGNQTVCSDGSTTQTLTATATGGTITWYTAATGGSLVASPTQVGVGTSTYYAESSNGTCSSLTRTAVTLTINATPEVTISGNSVLTCANESITLTATVQGTASYLWNTGATTATIEVTASGEYSVTVTDSNSGCSAMETVTVTGDSTPPAANISGNGVLTCATQSITLTASATVQGTASYLWNTGATTATIVVTAAGEYSVAVTDSDNGCSATATVTVAQDITPPAVNISGVQELTCNASSIVLNASGSAVQGTASYLWNTGATTASIEVNQAGDYTVVVTDSDNGCSNALTVAITENYVAAEILGGSKVLCISEVSLNLTTLLPVDFVSGGTWTDDMNSGGLTGNMFDPSAVNLGDYEFTYTEPGDCGRIITVSVNVNDDCVVLACSTEDMLISKVVTPNDDGFNDNFEITGLEGCDFTFGVKIFNRWGKMVYHSDNYLNNWKGRHDGSGMQIGSNSELPTGTYYYIVTVSGGTGFKPMTGYIYLGTH